MSPLLFAGAVATANAPCFSGRKSSVHAPNILQHAAVLDFIAHSSYMPAHLCSTCLLVCPSLQPKRPAMVQCSGNLPDWVCSSTVPYCCCWQCCKRDWVCLPVSVTAVRVRGLVYGPMSNCGAAGCRSDFFCCVFCCNRLSHWAPDAVVSGHDLGWFQ